MFKIKNKEGEAKFCPYHANAFSEERKEKIANVVLLPEQVDGICLKYVGTKE